MTLSLTHSFVSAKPQSADTSLVSKNAWNEEHILTAAGLSVLARAVATSGDVSEVTAVSGTNYPLRESGGTLGFGTLDFSVLSGFSGLTELTGLNLADDDLLLVYDTSAGVSKKLQRSQFVLDTKIGELGQNFWTLGATSKIWNRLFIGGAALNSGEAPGNPKDWLEDLLEYGVTQNAQFASLSSVGLLGGVFGSRVSDAVTAFSLPGDGSGGTLALTAYSLNDGNTAPSGNGAWARYALAIHLYNYGYTFGDEIDMAVYSTASALDPYNTPDLGTAINLQLSCGGGGTPAYPGAGTAQPVSAGINFSPNPIAFGKGIVFRSGALDTSVGVSGGGVAIDFAKSNEIRWLYATGAVGFNVYSSIDTSSSNKLSLIAANASFSLKDSANVSLFENRRVANGSVFQVGEEGSRTGSFVLTGAGGGYVTIAPQATSFTAWNFNLPTTAGSAGQALTSQGGVSSVMTWVNYQPLDADLTALAANSTDGFWAHTGAGTGAARTLTAPAAGFTITNPAGIAGNPTFVLANDLSALEGLSSTGIAVRTAIDAWAQRTLQAPAAGFTITNPAGVAGDPTFVLANDLAALEALSGTDTIYRRSGVDTWSAVTIAATLSFSSGTLGIDLSHANTWTGAQRFNTANPHFGHVSGTGAGFWLDSTSASDRFFFGQDAAIDDYFRIYSALAGTNIYAVASNATPANSLVQVVGTEQILYATSIPAGGTAGYGYKFSSTSNFGVFFGSGTPTLSAAKGSLYLRSDGSTTNDRAYINTNGSTTWTALTTAA